MRRALGPTSPLPPTPPALVLTNTVASRVSRHDLLLALGSAMAAGGMWARRQGKGEPGSGRAGSGGSPSARGYPGMAVLVPRLLLVVCQQGAAPHPLLAHTCQQRGHKLCRLWVADHGADLRALRMGGQAGRRPGGWVVGSLQGSSSAWQAECRNSVGGSRAAAQQQTLGSHPGPEQHAT